MKPGRDPLTLAELQRRFSDEAECRALLERARWPNGPVCPRCGSIDHASRITTRPGDFTCLDCERRFSVTAGTPMDHTHLPICTWIIAAYLLTTSSKGISSLKLASLLGLQYRTTWHLARRIRAMMADAPDLLRGLVELDETYIGGKGRKRNRPQPPAPVRLFEQPEPPKPQKPAKRRRRGKRALSLRSGEGPRNPNRSDEGPARGRNGFVQMQGRDIRRGPSHAFQYFWIPTHWLSE